MYIIGVGTIIIFGLIYEYWPRKILTHNVFGDIKRYHNLWKREIEFIDYKDVLIELHGDKTGPYNSSIEIFDELKQRYVTLKKNLIKDLLNDYMTLVDALENDDSIDKKELENIDINNILKHCNLKTITIMNSTITLSYYLDWDSEHQRHVTIENWEVTGFHF